MLDFKKEITVTRENGENIFGRYQKPTPMSSEKYREFFQAFRAENDIPANMSIVLDAGGNEHEIPISKIREVTYKNNNTGKTVGFVLGLAVDAAFVVAAVTNEQERRSTNMSFSCPFVYSFDGREYTLDSETFGGKNAAIVVSQSF